MPDIAYLSADLMFPSRVVGVTRRRGWSVQVSANRVQLIDRLKSEPARALLIDVASAGTGGCPALLAELREEGVLPPGVIAYGPHVQEDLLDSAEAAGCVTLTRGQFDANMEAVLERALAQSGGSSSSGTSSFAG